MNNWHSSIDSANSGCILKLFLREREKFRENETIHMIWQQKAAAAQKNRTETETANGGMFYVAQHFW